MARKSCGIRGGLQGARAIKNIFPKKKMEKKGEEDERSIRQLFALHPKQLFHNIWVIKDTFIQIQIQYPYAHCLTTRECHTDWYRSRYRTHMAAINIKKDKRWGWKLKTGYLGSGVWGTGTCHLNRNQKQNWFKFENVNNTRQGGRI